MKVLRWLTIQLLAVGIIVGCSDQQKSETSSEISGGLNKEKVEALESPLDSLPETSVLEHVDFVEIKDDEAQKEGSEE
ncbi:MAG: hypothetical protein RIF33_20410 [Cyclobacteriaceae bacterium]